MDIDKLMKAYNDAAFGTGKDWDGRFKRGVEAVAQACYEESAKICDEHADIAQSLADEGGELLIIYYEKSVAHKSDSDSIRGLKRDD